MSKSRSVQARIEEVRACVFEYYRLHGRHDLPWRLTRDPYHIMVSEMMLQQTQVPRVIEKYASFLTLFPRVETLASAPLTDVLREWSGLGYNRRGKFLHDAAKVIASEYNGTVPSELIALKALPGMGPYTASAVRVFAHNIPDVLIETNVRAVYAHHFFPGRVGITEADIARVAARTAEGLDPREWHSALMDYGTHIKKTQKNPAKRVAVYKRQSRFEGSLRQVRGAILRAVHSRVPLTSLPYERERMRLALEALIREGLVEKGQQTEM